MARKKLSREEVEEIVREAREKGERPDLSTANLSGTDLSEAELTRANLSAANLSTANLSGADLSMTYLNRADLSMAYLNGAKLGMAYLNGADLGGADFSRASIGWTTFGNTDLSEVKGLETVEHEGPSTIGIDTLFRSKGHIPETFLRGAGVPEILITYLPSMLGQAIQYYSCFISYASKDTPFAERLHNDLQAKGVRCWFAPEDLKIGERIRVGIDQSIRVHDKLLLILSEHSLASDWVEQEVETAMEQERQRKETVLFPVRLDEAVMQSQEGWAAHIKRSRNIGNFGRWQEHESYQKALQRLLRDLKVENASPPS
jgi:hypothetical protein